MIVSDPKVFAAHARQLARAFHVALIEDPRLRPHDAAAMPAPAELAAECAGVVGCAPITDDTTYAVAMHEIGHLLSPTGALGTDKRRARSTSREWNLTIEEETSAWEWARAHAIDWTVGMEAVRTYALGTYQTGRARALHHVDTSRARLQQYWRMTRS